MLLINHETLWKSVRQWLRGLVLTLVIGLSLGATIGVSPAQAGLPPGDAITDPKALLRYALPIDNREIRKIQISLEHTSNGLRGKRWNLVQRDIKDAKSLLSFRQGSILEAIAPDQKDEASALLDDLKDALERLTDAAAAEDKSQVIKQRAQALDLVGRIEFDMVQGYPFEIPEEYSNLPQLKGRATIAVETTRGDVTLVLDGFNAPITAGNFFDLVQRGFYDGLPFTRTEANYVAQIGDPPGPDTGFVDSDTGEYRTIPLEIMVQGESEPLYGFTFEEIGLYLEQPSLPFSAYGALGMARPGDDNDGASSQFFFQLFDSEMTPAGLNLLDGRYAVFGYTVEGQDVLEEIRQGDKIIKAEVIDGAENFILPG